MTLGLFVPIASGAGANILQIPVKYLQVRRLAPFHQQALSSSYASHYANANMNQINKEFNHCKIDYSHVLSTLLTLLGKQNNYSIA